MRKRYYHINYYQFCSDCREHGHLSTRCPNFYVRYCVYCLSVFHKEEYCYRPEEQTNLVFDCLNEDLECTRCLYCLEYGHINCMNHDPNAS